MVKAEKKEVGRMTRVFKSNSGMPAEEAVRQPTAKDGAFVSYTEGDGASLTLFSDMHPLFNEYCIEKTTLGGDSFGNSEE